MIYTRKKTKDTVHYVHTLNIKFKKTSVISVKDVG